MSNQPTADSGRSRDSSACNAFGMALPSLGNILAHPRIEQFVEQALRDVAEHIGIPPERSSAIVNQLRSLAGNSSSLAEYEKAGHGILANADLIAALPQKLMDRARLIHSQITPWVVGADVCDLGCGDGKVGELIAADGKKVSLADVYQHPHIESTGLHFSLFRQGAPVPFADKSADTTLLLTVLHHADDPVALLREAIRLTRPGGRIILIESVYGITPEQAAEAKAESFGALSFEEQRLTNIFFDHLYNRLIHYSSHSADKVNVPFNFNTPKEWERLLSECGAPQIHLQMLGIDQRAVPEFHTLHVGEVRR